ncbi:MAG: hypothetical protein Q8935_21170 [Bacillota bacterium]|jgi:hypothetical protein|nr:hypothetical protein [Bacillota bacterium]
MEKYSLIISIVSFLVSVVTGIFSYRYNKITIRNTAILEHNKLLLEIDKILINDPKLWSIYDDHPLSKDESIAQDPSIFNAKKEAFIYYYLNLFDVIYEFYHRQIVKNKNDAKQWQAWIQFIKHFLKGCSQARSTIKKSYHLYDEDQECFYKKLIEEIESERSDLSGG